MAAATAVGTVAAVEREEGPDDEGMDPRVPVPAPDDRLWRHPSELAAAGTGVAEVGPARGSRTLLGVTVVASVAASALLVTGLLAATVGLGSSLRDRSADVSVSTAASVDPVAFSAGSRLAGSTGRGLATVAVVGSGGRRVGGAVVLDDGGRLATAAPLVADASALTVTLDDGTQHQASVAAVDVESGIAVLAIDRTATVAARWSSAAGLRPGDPVQVRLLGGGTALDATVLGLGREVVAATGQTFDHLLALDAPAWSVDAGAPVVDADGRVVAIALLDATGAVHAVPIDIARGAGRGVAADGAVRAALLDVIGDALPEADARLLGVDGGARINDIDPDGPAALAGLGIGDVIIEVDGQAVSSFDCLVILIRAHQPGDALTITYLRDGQRATATAILGERTLKGA